jgi:hypothetical protein
MSNLCEQYKKAVAMIARNTAAKFLLQKQEIDDLKQDGFIELLRLQKLVDFTKSKKEIDAYVFTTLRGIMHNKAEAQAHREIELEHTNKLDDIECIKVTVRDKTDVYLDLERLNEARQALTTEQNSLIDEYLEGDAKIIGGNANQMHRHRTERAILALRNKLLGGRVSIRVALEALREYPLPSAVMRTGWHEACLRGLCKRWNITPKTRKLTRGNKNETTN